MLQHHFCGLGGDQLPEAEVVSFLRQFHCTKGFFIIIVSQRDIINIFGTQVASHVVCVLDIFL